MKKILVILVLMSGCASNPHLDLRRGDGYGDNYCPTSGIITVGLLAGIPAGVIASPAVGVGVALVSSGIMAANTIPWYEINCDVKQEDVVVSGAYLPEEQ